MAASSMICWRSSRDLAADLASEASKSAIRSPTCKVLLTSSPITISTVASIPQPYKSTNVLAPTALVDRDASTQSPPGARRQMSSQRGVVSVTLVTAHM